MKLIYLSLILCCPFAMASQDIDTSFIDLRDYIYREILDSANQNITIWTTPEPLDSTYIFRSKMKLKYGDIQFPPGTSWLIMIDRMPDANFGHPVELYFIDRGLSRHSQPLLREFPPIVLRDTQDVRPVEFKCRPMTPTGCATSIDMKVTRSLLSHIVDDSCKFAVIVSGGVDHNSNKPYYYATNLKSVYRSLRNAGFPKSQIFVYYADGTLHLDCDNADGDNDDNTGSDLTGGAIQSQIRDKISSLCLTMHPDEDVIFTYFSNHGADEYGIALWDIDSNGLDYDELYSPAELAKDVADCKALRHFSIHDQCYAGDFLPMVSDGSHDNSVVYCASKENESTWGREYMDLWEDEDVTTTTLNDMHAGIVNSGMMSSTPVMAEGTPGFGDWLLSTPCQTTQTPISSSGGSWNPLFGSSSSTQGVSSTGQGQ